jgi:tRNA threonylcarbamoyladenosine biosynthesis protein TsaB
LRILSLETSLRQGSVAALVGEAENVHLEHELELPPSARSAQTLIPTVAELLKSCHWQPTEVDLVCVTTGPGSFTGLRIGVTAAKTFAFAVNAQLVGVHTLAAPAASVLAPKGRLWSIMDAQRQELFAATFDDNGEMTEPVTRIISIDAWLTQLRSGDSVVGPPLAQLASKLPAGVTAVDADFWQPQARVVGQLGYQLFLKGKTVDPIQLSPRYYRKSAAEEKAALRTQEPVSDISPERSTLG